MYAALSLQIQMGIRILNYLDDWLVLAQSEDELLSLCSSALIKNKLTLLISKHLLNWSRDNKNKMLEKIISNK